MDKEGDFPGVCFPGEAEVWRSICPDPSAFFPEFVKQKTNSSIESILRTRNNHLGKSLSISYRKPLHIVRGYRQYLYDHTGRRFLDTVNNVAHVGHQHPKVVRAAQQQIGVLNTNTRYLHHKLTDYAKALLEKGKLVAIPTETVYGLAGNGLNVSAVAKIFEVKNRPSFDPMILHTNDLEKIKPYTFR